MAQRPSALFVCLTENTLKPTALCATYLMWKEKRLSLTLPPAFQSPSSQSKEIKRKWINVPCTQPLYEGKKKKSIQQKINPRSFLELYLNENIYGFFSTMAENESRVILSGLELLVSALAAGCVKTQQPPAQLQQSACCVLIEKYRGSETNLQDMVWPSFYLFSSRKSCLATKAPRSALCEHHN